MYEEYANVVEDSSYVPSEADWEDYAEADVETAFNRLAPDRRLAVLQRLEQSIADSEKYAEVATEAPPW